MISRKYVKRLNSLKKVSSSLYLFSVTKGFTRLFSLFAIWVSLHVFCHELILKLIRILRMTSPLLIILIEREGIIGYLMPCRYSGIIASLNSMRVRKWRDNLQATHEFRVFPFIPPQWSQPFLVPSLL